jgi:hypothetical protein
MGVNLGAGESRTVEFTYGADADPPATVTLTVRLLPHSVGFACGPGSAGGMDAATYPVAAP